MKYSQATDYALHAMLYLVMAAPDKPVDVQLLAECWRFADLSVQDDDQAYQGRIDSVRTRRKRWVPPQTEAGTLFSLPWLPLFRFLGVSLISNLRSLLVW